MRAAAYLEPLPSPRAVLEAQFQQHHALVYRVAYRVTGDAADAEDVLQTVFMRLLQRDDLPDLSIDAAAYFRRAAVNAALDLVRRRQFRQAQPRQDVLQAVSGVPLEPAPSPEGAGRDEQRALLREALAELHPRTAEMVVLRYLEGLDNKAVATLLGTSQAAVSVTLFRARRQLQKKLASVNTRGGK